MIHRTLAERLAEKCVHFNGIQHDRCDAGIAYGTVRIDHEPIDRAVASYPCRVSMNRCGTATCTHLQFPTPDEVAEWVRESNASFERIGAARLAIVAHIKESGEQSGYIKCPTCGGRLGYSRARSNGHIRAACDTPKCSRWTE